MLYNVTTRLSDNKHIIIKISKVHKMIRTNDYYGLFNDKINFETNIEIDIDNKTKIDTWWEKKGKKKIQYNRRL